MRIERAAWAALALWTAAAAAQSPTWNLGAGVDLGRDDNLFRAPAGEELEVDYRAASLNGTLDRTIGRQRLRADASVRETRFDRHSDLDNTGFGLKFVWQGASAGGVSWELSHGVDRRLSSYTSAQSTERRVLNLEQARQTTASVQFGAVAQWVGGLALSRRTLAYSAEAYAPDEVGLDTLALSATWRPLGPLSVSFGPRVTRGRYPKARLTGAGDFEAERFDRHDVDLGVFWLATGASTLRARLSLTRQRYKLLSDRDVESATGQFAWRWRVSGKTDVDLTLNRDTGSESSRFDLASPDGEPLRGSGDNSTLTTASSVDVQYAATAKIRLSAGARYVQRRLAASSRLDGGVPVSEALSGDDRTALASLGVRYAATRRSVVACHWTRARRSTDTLLLSSPYRSDAVVCSVQLSLR